jgi:hypothetical protein
MKRYHKQITQRMRFAQFDIVNLSSAPSEQIDGNHSCESAKGRTGELTTEKRKGKLLLLLLLLLWLDYSIGLLLFSITPDKNRYMFTSMATLK